MPSIFELISCLLSVASRPLLDRVISSNIQTAQGAYMYNVSRGRGCGINPSGQSIHNWTLRCCIPPANHSQPRPPRLHPLSSKCALRSRVLSHLHKLRLSWRADTHRLQYDEHSGHWITVGEEIWDTPAYFQRFPWHVPYLVNVHPRCVSAELGMSI